MYLQTTVEKLIIVNFLVTTVCVLFIQSFINQLVWPCVLFLISCTHYLLFSGFRCSWKRNGRLKRRWAELEDNCTCSFQVCVWYRNWPQVCGFRMLRVSRVWVWCRVAALSPQTLLLVVLVLWATLKSEEVLPWSTGPGGHVKALITVSCHQN